MKLIVYTAAIGETDTVQAPAVIDPQVEYVCFSDRPCPAPYERIAVPTEADGTPASRFYKILASHPRLQQAEATLWHDASYRLTSALDWARKELLWANAIAMRHPRRDRIEDEAIAIARWGHVTTTRALALVAEYRAAGFHAQELTSGGLIARRVSPQMTEMNARWWAEVQRWHYRDQACLDYVAWATNVGIAHVSGTVRNNPYAAWRVPVAA